MIYGIKELFPDFTHTHDDLLLSQKSTPTTDRPIVLLRPQRLTIVRPYPSDLAIPSLVKTWYWLPLPGSFRERVVICTPFLRRHTRSQYLLASRCAKQGSSEHSEKEEEVIMVKHLLGVHGSSSLSTCLLHRYIRVPLSLPRCSDQNAVMLVRCTFQA